MTLNLEKLRRSLYSQGYTKEVIDRVVLNARKDKPWALAFMLNNHVPIDAQHWEPAEDEAGPIMESEDDQSDYRKKLMEALNTLSSFVRSARNRGLAWDQIAWVCDLTITEKDDDGKAIGVKQLASRWGVSKQAFSKGALQFAKQLGIKPGLMARKEAARLNMRNSNIRRN
jgi:hypothetical protein